MKKNFVESAVVRQNVLNNTIAMDTLQQTLSLDGVMFESKLTFIKRQVAEFFEVTERTIDYCIEKNEKEIAKNGYEVLRGKRLVDYKLAFQNILVTKQISLPKLRYWEFLIFVLF